MAMSREGRKAAAQVSSVTARREPRARSDAKEDAMLGGAWPSLHIIGEAAAAIRELPADALKLEVQRRLDWLLVEAGGMPLLPPASAKGSKRKPAIVLSAWMTMGHDLTPAWQGIDMPILILSNTLMDSVTGALNQAHWNGEL